jgi:hypothetical protein
MITMTRKLKRKYKNIPLDIDDHPIGKNGSVHKKDTSKDASPVQSPTEVSPSKQRQLDALIPYKFKPGQTGNPSGRPKDVLRAIGQRIAKASVKRYLTKDERQLAEDLDFKPDEINMIESIMLSLATSKNPAKIEMFLERVYGKVPNININAEISAALVARFRAKFTDAELERIASGDDALEVLVDKLPDINEDVVDAEEVE